MVEFSDEEAERWFDGRDRFSEAGWCVDMLVAGEVPDESEATFALRRRQGEVLPLRKDGICSFGTFWGEDPINPLSFRFIVDPLRGGDRLWAVT